MTLSTWDPTAPLQRGVTLLEASAGTGKTFGITSVLVRLVAEEGIPIERVLLVTFTRAATAELEDRVRGRLVEAIVALEAAERPGDPVLAHLWDLGRDDAELRRLHLRRLRDAVEGFDQALISTIHGFCQRMLQQHAFESRADFGLELSPDVDDLVEELVDDHLVASFHDADAAEIGFLREVCGFRRDALIELAKRALGDPDVQVVPAPDAHGAGAWAALVADLRARWAALGADFVAYVHAQHQSQKAGSLLKPGQRKINAGVARAWVDGVANWLDRDPDWTEAVPGADTFDAKQTARQLVDEDQPLAHPALDAIAALRRVPADVASCRRAAFVQQAREAFEARKARRRVQTYQDLLRGLALRLGPGAPSGERAALAAAIGAGFDAALIDEFQDTDADQWAIFGTCFGSGRHHLFLIGDPKQAIYGFRGANIHVYAQATRAAGPRRFTMRTNWRSDARLLAALNHLLDRPRMFGSADFDYVRVQASPKGAEDGLRPPFGWAAPGAAALQVRWFDGRFVGLETEDEPGKGVVEAALPARVAQDIVALLADDGAPTRLRDGEDWRAVQPRDIAVLVRKGKQAVAVQEALTAAGVPAVLAGAASVLASDEALTVQRWLAALGDTAGGSAARVAAATLAFGWTAERLLAVEAEAPEAVEAWNAWLGRLAAWRKRIGRDGFMTTFRRALDQTGALPRLLALADGERRVTNLLHAAELVHAAEVRERLRPSALLAWLKRRRSDGDLEAEETELRLDRDADAVQILTMHKSKGLEFPICFVPFLWDGGGLSGTDLQALLFAHPEDRTRRLLDVHADPRVPPKSEHARIARRDAQEEALRLAYVALTRARHRCVIYCGAVNGYGGSPIAAILHGGDAADRLAAAEAAAADPAGLRADVEALAAARGDDGAPLVDGSVCAPPAPQPWTPRDREVPELATRAFTRRALDPFWRRHSYTSLARAAGHAHLVLEEEGREGFDRDAQDAAPAEPVAVPDPIAPEDEVPLARFPAGADAGTLLHEVFEQVDFAVARPEAGDDDAARAAVGAVARDRLAAHGFDAALEGVLADGLLRALRTPLGEALGELRLCDLPRGVRLDELRFDLPLAGGTRAAEAVNAGTIAAVLRSRADGRLPADWLATLHRLDDLRLAGFLTGSIDLVFRAPVPGEDRPRWFVADYKSNRLDPQGTRRCVPSAFGGAGMRHEMGRHDYFLQYHLYLVALHRYLRWRLPDYDYDRDMGGAYYLFFRGMLGPGTVRDGAAVRGCFHDRPPRATIEALDAAFTAAAMGGAA